MVSSPRADASFPSRLLLGAILTLLAANVLRYGWVTDDAFITFRSVLNLLDGNGPVFNIGERVQSFTHPLWFLLLCLLGWLDLNLYFAAILLGYACTGLAVLALLRLGDDTSRPMLLLALLLLATSEAVLGFSTSGLENALSHLLLVLVVRQLHRHPADAGLPAYLLLSALVLNRFDNIILAAPLGALALFGAWRAGRLRPWQPLLGALPLLAWHGFSLVYYGFLFPNTKYAKLGGGSLPQVLKTGLAYLVESVEGDLFAFALMTAAGIFVLLTARRNLDAPVVRLRLGLLVGIGLHALYVVFFAGGDFMRGRFFTIDIVALACILTLVRLPPVAPARLVAIALVAVPTALASHWFSVRDLFWYDAYGIHNERQFFGEFLPLHREPAKNYTSHPWAEAAKARPEAQAILGVNGQLGYWVDRKVRLIDPVGLTDAFIARTPVTDATRPGHFTRAIPREYLRERIEGVTTEEWNDPELQSLHRHLRIITEAPELFTAARWRSMLWVWRRYGL